MKTLLTIFLALIALFCGGCSLLFLGNGIFTQSNPYTGLGQIYPIILIGLTVAAMAIAAILLARELGKASCRNAKAKTIILASLVAILTLIAAQAVNYVLFGGFAAELAIWLITLAAAALVGFGTYRLFAKTPDSPKP